MSQQDLLIKVVRLLDEVGVDYMVTGSIASSLQGEPRATHDIDLVVAMTHDVAPRLVEVFRAPDYYLDPEAVKQAIDTKGMFNLLAITTGDRVDFWMLTDEAFDRSRFARKRSEPVFGIRLQVPTPEDTILAKLLWSKNAGGSAKQLGDVLRVYEVNAPSIDIAYIDHWATQLSVMDSWSELQSEAELF